MAIVACIVSPAHAVPKGLPPAAIGTVTGVGEVYLRTAALRGDGTLFPGDEVRTGPKGYAYIALESAQKVRVDPNAVIVVNLTKDGPRVVVKKGSVSPAMPPTNTQAPRGRSGLQLDKPAWIAIASGGAVAAVAIATVVIGNRTRTDLRELRKAFEGLRLSFDLTDLQRSLAEVEQNLAESNRTFQEKIAALNRANAASAAARDARLLALESAMVAEQLMAAVQTSPALTAAQRSAFNARAAALRSQSTLLSQNANSVQAQILALQAHIAASPSPTQAQLDQLSTLISALVTIRNEIATVAQLINQLRSDLICLPQCPPFPIPPPFPAPPPVASASAPVN